MLRITVRNEEAAPTLVVEGWLRGEHVGELRRACAALRCAPWALELSGLAYADPEGAGELVRLRNQGARLTGGSSLLLALIKEAEHGRGD